MLSGPIAVATLILVVIGLAILSHRFYYDHMQYGPHWSTQDPDNNLQLTYYDPNGPYTSIAPQLNPAAAKLMAANIPKQPEQRPITAFSMQTMANYMPVISEADISAPAVSVDSKQLADYDLKAKLLKGVKSIKASMQDKMTDVDASGNLVDNNGPTPFAPKGLTNKTNRSGYYPYLAWPAPTYFIKDMRRKYLESEMRMNLSQQGLMPVANNWGELWDAGYNVPMVGSIDVKDSVNDPAKYVRY